MRPTPLVVAVLLGSLGGGAFAQEPSGPPALRLPVGARVRVRPVASPGEWVRGTLMGADSAGVGFLPEGAPPIPGSELRLPKGTIARLEILTGTKRHWLHGLIVGAAAGVAMGFAFDVDPDRCHYDDNYFCSRGEAVAAGGLVLGGIGAGVGALVQSDVWFPVALDALGPSEGPVGRVQPELRAAPGRVALGVTVRF
jgi:hypothetical protein